ncbi:MAG: response regulator [archaeon]
MDVDNQMGLKEILGILDGIENVPESVKADIRMEMQRQERLDLLLSNHPSMLFVTDGKGRILDFYGSDEETYVKPADFLGRTASEVLPPHVSGTVMRTIAEASKAGYARNEYSLDLPSGTGHYSLRTRAAGPDNGLFVHCVDNITMRIRAEYALIERAKELNGLYSLGELSSTCGGLDELLLRFVTEIAPQSMKFAGQAIAVIELDGSIYSNSENKPARSLFAPILDDGKTKGTLTLGYSEDLPFIEVHEQKLVDAYAERLGKLIQRREAADAQRESEARYRTIFTGAAEGILIADLQTTIFRYANPAVCRMFGYTEGEFLQRGVADIHPEESLESIMAEFGAQARGEKVLAQDIPCLRKDGTLFYADINTAESVLGGHSCNVGFFTDVTERNNMEMAMVSRERLGAIGELASGVAHDFNNSLQIIFGNIELALLAPDLSPGVREYLNIIKTSAGDAAARILQLQRFAGKGRMEDDCSPVDLGRLLDETIDQARPMWKDGAEENGLVFSIHRNYSEARTVDGNPGALRTAFYNLIKNGIEAMPGGGALSFETGSTDKGVYVRVSDTGVGMDAETRLRIFQPFYSTKGLEQGRGLGMSAVYAIIREHGGDVHVLESAPGKGTTIEMVLPYGTMKAESQPYETPSEYQCSARVLWVDDEEQIRTFGQRILEDSGHRVDTATSGADALRLLEDRRYDLIITDVGMPGMSGWQFAERIKGRYEGTKVAVVTGWGAEVTREQKERYGVGYVLGKPIDLDTLEGLVREVMQLKPG